MKKHLVLLLSLCAVSPVVYAGDPGATPQEDGVGRRIPLAEPAVAGAEKAKAAEAKPQEGPAAAPAGPAAPAPAPSQEGQEKDKQTPGRFSRALHAVCELPGKAGRGLLTAARATGSAIRTVGYSPVLACTCVWKHRGIAAAFANVLKGFFWGERPELADARIRTGEQGIYPERKLPEVVNRFKTVLSDHASEAAKTRTVQVKRSFTLGTITAAIVAGIACHRNGASRNALGIGLAAGLAAGVPAWLWNGNSAKLAASKRARSINASEAADHVTPCEAREACAQMSSGIFRTIKEYGVGRGAALSAARGLRDATIANFNATTEPTPGIRVVDVLKMTTPQAQAAATPRAAQ